MNNYTTSSIGIDLIKRFEGFKSRAYRDSAGVLTIGFGHTKGVKDGDIITESQAERFLIEDLKQAESAVISLTAVDLSQNQFDALVSFVFNVGIGAFKQSTLRKKLNAGDFFGAQKEFAKWDKYTNPKTGKKESLKGLTNRRLAEAKLFGMLEESKPLTKSRMIRTTAATGTTAAAMCVEAGVEAAKSNAYFFESGKFWIFAAMIAAAIYIAYLKYQDNKQA